MEWVLLLSALIFASTSADNFSVVVGIRSVGKKAILVYQYYIHSLLCLDFSKGSQTNEKVSMD